MRVRSLRRTWPGRAAWPGVAKGRPATEHLLEEITEVRAAGGALEWAARRMLVPTGGAGMAKAVVRGALLRIRQNGVRVGDLAEALRRRRVIADIRMVLPRKAAIRRPDVVVTRASLETEHRVEIRLALGCQGSSLAPAVGSVGWRVYRGGDAGTEAVVGTDADADADPVAVTDAVADADPVADAVAGSDADTDAVTVADARARP